MKIIYLVHGYTGEYEDRYEWIVSAFTTKRKADNHAKKAQDFANKQKYREWDSTISPNPFDAGMSLDYTGTTYIVGKTKLL